MRIMALATLGLLLSACGSSGSSNPTASPSGTPGATSSPSSTPAATSSPSATSTPAATPTPTSAPACSPGTGGTASRATVVDVRVGTYAGYDRLVVEFDRAVPSYEVTPNADGTHFVSDPKGEMLTVAGAYGVHVRLTDIDMPNSYPHGTDLRPGFPVLKEARVIGDFEGVVNLAIGLGGRVCPAVTTLSGPPRLVVDFPSR